MKTTYPDYKKCLANFSCSILKHFGIKEEGKSTLRKIDQLLKEENYQNIVVLLYDGMGSKVLDSILPKGGFLLQHKILDITSVVPSTTMTATTSFLSAKFPYEHGWVGWHMYFKEYNKTVAIAENTIKNTSEVVSPIPITETKLKYDSIIERINQETEAKAYGIFPFGMGAYQKREDAYQRIINLTQHEGKKFIYAYFAEPDHLMHIRGVQDRRVEDEVFLIQDEVEKLSETLQDSLILVVADHGLVDCEAIYLDQYPNLYNLLERTTSIESRCCSFKIKDGYQKKFKDLFLQYFEDEFLLYSREEVIEQQLFGMGVENEYFSDAIGDFIAIAISDKYLNYNKEDFSPVATHAGLTRDEMVVPIIAIKKKVSREVIRKVEMKDLVPVRELANCFHKERVEKRKDIFQKASIFGNTEFVTLCNRSTPSTCLVYEIGEEIVGFIEIELVVVSGSKLYNEYSYLQIERIYIKEEYRRRGIATKLYQAALEYAKKNRLKRVEIVIWEFDEEARKFVQSLNPKILNETFEILL